MQSESDTKHQKLKAKRQTPPRLVIRIRICVFLRHFVGERYWIEWCPPDIAYRKVGMPATQKACWQCQRREESVTFRICCTLITDNRMSFVGRSVGMQAVPLSFSNWIDNVEQNSYGSSNFQIVRFIVDNLFPTNSYDYIRIYFILLSFYCILLCIMIIIMFKISIFFVIPYFFLNGGHVHYRLLKIIWS